MKQSKAARQRAADKKFEQAAASADRARTNGASPAREKAARLMTEGNALVRGAKVPKWLYGKGGR